MLPASSISAYRIACFLGRESSCRFLFFILLLALTLSGCAKHDRGAVATGSKPAQGSLSSLYTRLPDAAARERASLQAGMITPQSELSLAVCQNQALRLQGEFQRSGLKFGAPIFIRIFKESHELELWVQRGGRFHLFKKYPIAYFSGGLGPKLHEGDLQAPEGYYEVFPSLMNPWSNFHLAFNIGYPNLYDQARQASTAASTFLPIPWRLLPRIMTTSPRPSPMAAWPTLPGRTKVRARPWAWRCWKA